MVCSELAPERRAAAAAAIAAWIRPSGPPISVSTQLRHRRSNSPGFVPIPVAVASVDPQAVARWCGVPYRTGSGAISSRFGQTMGAASESMRTCARPRPRGSSGSPASARDSARRGCRPGWACQKKNPEYANTPRAASSTWMITATSTSQVPATNALRASFLVSRRLPAPQSSTPRP